MTVSDERKDTRKKRWAPEKTGKFAIQGGDHETSVVRKRKRSAESGPFLYSGIKAVHTIRQGGSVRALDSLGSLYEIDDATLCRLLGMSPRTLIRRRQEGSVSKTELDRATTLRLVMDDTIALFEGDKAKARRWLKQPVRALSNERPIDLLDTEAGIRTVRELIGQLEYGVYA